MTVVPDQAALAKALDSALPRVIAMARAGKNPNAKVPGLDWTAAEVGTHLVMALLVFAASIRGDELTYEFGDEAPNQTMPEFLKTANDKTLKMLGPKTLEDVAEGLEAAHAELQQVFASELDLEAECAAGWYGVGQTRTVGTLLALAVTETLAHGWDLAGALKLDRWFETEEAVVSFPTVMSQMLPLLVDPRVPQDYKVSFEVRITGGQPFIMRLAERKAWTEPAGGEVDCIIEMDPVWGLLVGFRRIPLWKALLKGKVKTSGPKPWLGMKFQSSFMSA